jgi:transforming growth factor-beta-induced protein
VSVPKMMISRGILDHPIDVFLEQLTNLVETVRINGNFKTLYQAILWSGFTLTLAGSTGPFTIFAPTDDAFAKLSSETLQYLFKPENQQVLADILSYHISAGNLTVATIKTLNPPVKVPVFSGQSVLISQESDKLEVNDATVIASDILASNGVIHGIDTVLLAPFGNIADSIALNPNFGILFKALQAADLLPTLRSSGPWTLFAPTDYAFQKLPPGTLDSLLKPENKVLLLKTLTYHLADGNLTSTALEALNPPINLNTFNRKTVRVTEYGKNIFINDATVVMRNLPAKNGLIHGINQVLLPSEL